MTPTESSIPTEAEMALYRSGERVEAVKLYRSRVGIGLSDAAHAFRREAKHERWKQARALLDEVQADLERRRHDGLFTPGDRTPESTVRKLAKVVELLSRDEP